MFSLRSTKQLPGLNLQKIFAASKRTALSELLRGRAENTLLDSLRTTSKPPSTKRSGLAVKVVTRADYPTIVELKLAGRSDAEIARRFGISIDLAIGHISQALSDYKKRKLQVRPDRIIDEALKVGEERASLAIPNTDQEDVLQSPFSMVV